MKLMDFLEVCNEPIIVEKIDECGDIDKFYITGSNGFASSTAQAMWRGEEYGLFGDEDIDEIWHDDGFLTVTLQQMEAF